MSRTGAGPPLLFSGYGGDIWINCPYLCCSVAGAAGGGCVACRQLAPCQPEVCYFQIRSGWIIVDQPLEVRDCPARFTRSQEGLTDPQQSNRSIRCGWVAEYQGQ